MIWVWTDPTTGRTVRSTTPPSRYVAPEPIRTPRSIRNSSPHRPDGITRNGALSTQNNDDD